MAVLTNLLSVQKLSEEEVKLSQKYINQLKRQHTAFKNLTEAFDVRINDQGDLGCELYNKEKEVFKRLFNVTNNIPKEFKTSCFGKQYKYIDYLDKLSDYPIVSLSQLKEIADALSFVILPINYVNMGSVFEMYRKADVNDSDSWSHSYSYSREIKEAFDSFSWIIKACAKDNFIRDQNIYILAPLSFYDAWLEVKAEKVLPKYFSNKLFNLSTTLGIVIPSQRNLFKMAQTNNENIMEMKKTMDANFEMLKQSIEDCHSRIDWVETMASRMQKATNIRLRNIELKQQKMEEMLYCFLDPIIFSVDDGVDISRSENNNAKARIGLCFGPEMPLDFFVARGLKTIVDKRDTFKRVTKILHPHIEINADK